MYSEQEQEEIDYQIGAQSEQQNALTLSMINKKPDDSAKIYQKIKEGKFLLIGEVTDYCQYTDAICGYSKYIISEHDTKEQAVQAAKEYGESDPDPEFNVHILGDIGSKPLVPLASRYQDDEIPF